MLLRPDAFWVWKDPIVRERLHWYYSVMNDERPSKVFICRKIPFTLNIDATPTEELWRHHERLADEFQTLHNHIASGEIHIEDLPHPSQGLLDLKIELIKRMLLRCELCEWHCRINRVEGRKKGACHLNAEALISTWFHHYGEEPPLVGTGGSGTIFFSGCVFRCVFCQNWDISQDPSNGVVLSPKQLVVIMKSLRREGAHNINFVGGEPTPNLPVILEAMKLLDVNVPMLWNSDMYLTTEAMEVLRDVIDIWLPDFKYGNDKCAVRLSKVMRYFEVVSRNHRVAHAHGDMIIRHLVLPNHLECCTKPILRWIAENCPRALVNIMGQYRPEHLVAQNPSKYADIARRLSSREMKEARSYAEELGIIYQPVS